jgi:predicted DNA-binding protein (UPF0278 family)
MTEKKVKKLVETQKKYEFHLYQDDIQLILEVAQEHPRWSVDRIFKEALQTRMRNGVIIYVTPKIHTALKEAAKMYKISIDAVAYEAMKKWLIAHNFYKIIPPGL